MTVTLALIGPDGRELEGHGYERVEAVKTTIVLGSYECGSSMNDEADYNAWISFMLANSPDDYSIDSTSWKTGAPDRIMGHQAAEAREWLDRAREEFCRDAPCRGL